jgi:hypothetical protein
LYERLANGDISSFSLKKRGSRKGLRLIDRLQLDNYLSRKAAEASQRAASKAGTEPASTQPEIDSEEDDPFSEFELGGKA